MEFGVLRLFDYVNVFFAGIFLVIYIIRLSDKKSMTNKYVCYLIGVLMSLSGMAFCHLTGMSRYSEYRIVIDLAAFAVTVVVTTVAVNGDGLLRKLLIITTYFFPVFFFAFLMDEYFKTVFGIPVSEYGNEYLLGIFKTFLVTISIVYSVCVILFIGRKVMAGYLNSILIMLLFSLMGFMDLSFLLHVAPTRIGFENVFGATIQNMIVASVSMALLGMLSRSNEVISRERKQSELKMLRDTNKSYYDSVQADIDRARKLKHDIANYIEQIEYLIAHPEIDSDNILRSMVNELKIKSASIESRKYCEDSLVNMILTLKDEKCREKGIVFKAKVNPVHAPDIEPLDRSAILSNLLDNAINAAGEYRSEGNEAQVAVSIGTLGDNYVLRVENDTVYDGEINNIKELMKSFSSRKSDKGHGYGLTIIEENVSKNNGEIIVNIKDHKCVIIVTIKTNKEGVISNV